MQRAGILLCSLVVAVLASVAPASAEWFTDFCLGGARTQPAQVSFDVSYLRPATGITVFPLTALLMARDGFPKDDEVTEGRLQPYAGLRAVPRGRP